MTQKKQETKNANQSREEQAMGDKFTKKSDGVWPGAVKNTSDIPLAKIPLHARETMPMIKLKKPATTSTYPD